MKLLTDTTTSAYYIKETNIYLEQQMEYRSKVTDVRALLWKGTASEREARGLTAEQAKESVENDLETLRRWGLEADIASREKALSPSLCVAPGVASEEDCALNGEMVVAYTKRNGEVVAAAIDEGVFKLLFTDHPRNRFKRGHKVLVRDFNWDIWGEGEYVEYKDGEDNHIVAILEKDQNGVEHKNEFPFEQCIPLVGNEILLGTRGKSPE